MRAIFYTKIISACYIVFFQKNVLSKFRFLAYNVVCKFRGWFVKCHLSMTGRVHINALSVPDKRLPVSVAYDVTMANER